MILLAVLALATVAPTLTGANAQTAYISRCWAASQRSDLCRARDTTERKRTVCRMRDIVVRDATVLRRAKDKTLSAVWR